MRILIVVGGFYPGKNYGGIATSRGNFIHSLGGKNDIFVITTDHDYRSSEKYPGITEGWNQYDGALVRYLADADFNDDCLGNIIRSINPEIIYLSGTITSYFSYNKPVMRYASEHGISVIITPDGDMCTNALKIKAAKKLAAAAYCRLFGVFRNTYFQATQKEEQQNLKKVLGIQAGRIAFLPNLPYINQKIAWSCKTEGVLRLIYAARIHPIKNLDYALEAVISAESKIIFDIYGPIEDPVYWEKCRRIMERVPENCTIKYCGQLSPDEARSICNQYDAFLLPTKSENYCYSIEEALLCGCPVIISKGTTPWDDIHGVAGFAVPLTDMEGFSRSIDLLAKKNEAEYARLREQIRDYTIARLKYDCTCNQYMELFEKVKNKQML